jgi:hypothetical protein
MTMTTKKVVSLLLSAVMCVILVLGMAACADGNADGNGIEGGNPEQNITTQDSGPGNGENDPAAGGITDPGKADDSTDPTGQNNSNTEPANAITE